MLFSMTFRTMRKTPNPYSQSVSQILMSPAKNAAGPTLDLMRLAKNTQIIQGLLQNLHMIIAKNINNNLVQKWQTQFHKI